jgi:hypothetical protein
VVCVLARQRDRAVRHVHQRLRKVHRDLHAAGPAEAQRDRDRRRVGAVRARPQELGRRRHWRPRQHLRRPSASRAGLARVAPERRPRSAGRQVSIETTRERRRRRTARVLDRSGRLRVVRATAVPACSRAASRRSSASRSAPSIRYVSITRALRSGPRRASSACPRRARARPACTGGTPWGRVRPVRR